MEQLRRDRTGQGPAGQVHEQQIKHLHLLREGGVDVVRQELNPPGVVVLARRFKMVLERVVRPVLAGPQHAGGQRRPEARDCQRHDQR